jgi:hypothetical protein
LVECADADVTSSAATAVKLTATSTVDQLKTFFTSNLLVCRDAPESSTLRGVSSRRDTDRTDLWTAQRSRIERLTSSSEGTTGTAYALIASLARPETS